MSEIDENPEWTDEDFANAEGPESLSAVELAAFPKTAAKMGRPKSLAPKVPVKIRLDPDLLEALRAEGPGWQTRVNADLRAGLERRRG